MGCDGEKGTSERDGDRTEALGECAPFWSAWGYGASGRPAISTIKYSREALDDLREVTLHRAEG